jgi:hypothetical protein
MPMSANRKAIAEMQRLLGAAGAELVSAGDAVAEWAPDPNYKAQAYYAWRSQSEAEFRKALSKAGLEARPTTAADQAVWRLPDDVRLPGWDPVPAAGNTRLLQADGTVGSGAVWMRWHGGRAYLVVQPSGP